MLMRITMHRVPLLVAAAFLVIGIGFTQPAWADAQDADASDNAAHNLSVAPAKNQDAASTAGVLSAQSASDEAAYSGDGVLLQGGLKTEVVQGEYRFVLRWGEMPTDLDSHVEGWRPDGRQMHVYYADSSENYIGGIYCTLDVDDTTSYGPETVDLSKSSRFPCYYYVHQYSSGGSLPASGATVEVYKSGVLYKTYHVPTTGEGRCWNVCAVMEGQVIDRDTITSEPELNYASILRKWTTTSTDKRFYPDYKNRWKYGTNYFLVDTQSISERYPNFDATIGRGTFILPGLEFTNLGNSIGCDAMVPQGICATDSYILVSAYCDGKDMHELKLSGYDTEFFQTLDSHGTTGSSTTHNSVLYVLDKETGAYVCTVVLAGLPSGCKHVGGLAFDGENIWVATSKGTDGNGRIQECRIPKTTLETAVASREDPDVTTIAVGDMMVPLNDSGNKLKSASFNTYNPSDGCLWIGDFDNGLLAGFEISGGSLAKKHWFAIPAKANGATFYKDDYSNKVYLLVCYSYGRTNDSKLCIWDVTGLADGVSLGWRPCVTSLTLPPMLEECFVDDGVLYTVYEGGATIYSCFDSGNGRCTQSVDEICLAYIDSVLFESGESASDAARRTANRDVTRISVRCPVDVTVKDAEGNTVGVVSGNDLDELSLTFGIQAWVDGDAKHFIVPNDQGFSIEIAATADGVMSIESAQYGFDGSMQSRAVYENLPLVSGQSHRVDLADASSGETIEDRLVVTNPSGDAVGASAVVSDPDAFEMVSMDVGCVGDGTVAGGGDYVVAGDYVKLTAVAENDAPFYGWYSGNTLLSTSATYWAQASDAGIEARFGLGLHDIYDVDCFIDDDDLVYTGGEIKPSFTVKCRGVELVAGVDYTYVYCDNINAGWGYVMLTGKGNFDGQTEESFYIRPASIEPASISALPDSIYTGEAQEPAPKVKLGGKELAKGRDYSLYYEDNVSAGIATVFVEGEGNYRGSLAKTFKIAPAPIGKATINVGMQTYTGAALDPEPSVRLNGVELGLDMDFAVSYANNVNAGTASMVVTGKGNYTGTASATFKINPAEVTYVVLAEGVFTYTGAEQKPGVTAVKAGSLALRTSDYTVAYTNNVNAGTATVTVTGKGNYAGAISENFEIVPAELTYVALAKKSFTYNGKAKKPTVSAVRAGSLALGASDYTVAYKNNKKAGKSKASVIVTGTGNFTGSKAVKFTIKKAKNPLAVKAVAKTAKLAKGEEKLAKAKVLKGAIKITKKGKGKVTYTRVARGSSKRLAVNKKTGRITVKKGTKAGTYRIKVKVRAAGNANYKAKAKTVTVKVRVK